MTDHSNRPWFQLVAVFVAGALAGAFSAVQVAPKITTAQAVGQQASLEGGVVGEMDSGAVAAGGVPGAVAGGSQTTTSGAGGAVAGGTGAVSAKGLECARGRNGGATDVGVTGDRIKLATTTVQSGIGAAFLGDVKYAMEAVKNKINRAGGICGRLLEIKYVDDGWDASRGANYIRNFIKEGVFAIPVGPSSEGLRVVIDSGDIKRAGIPVVGTDGMLIDQYTDPWVWPVAVATASAARVMARNAHQHGAKKFSIVFDKNYRFGVEAARAYNNEVKRLTGASVPGYNDANNCDQSFCGILAGQSSYATEVNGFQEGEFLAMFLEPQTALTWMATAGAPKPSARLRVGAAQPLFTRDFANSCQSACDGMWVWTGYRPPIESYADEPAVRRFVDDLRRTKPDADVYNAFTEGGYDGMQLLVEALQKVGPLLTRARLKEALNSMTFDSGITLQEKLSWPSGNHFANATMQAFEIKFSATFSGWRTRDIEKDPTPHIGTN